MFWLCILMRTNVSNNQNDVSLKGISYSQVPVHGTNITKQERQGLSIRRSTFSSNFSVKPKEYIWELLQSYIRPSGCNPNQVPSTDIRAMQIRGKGTVILLS